MKEESWRRLELCHGRKTMVLAEEVQAASGGVAVQRSSSTAGQC